MSSDPQPLMFNGMRVIESVFLVQDGEPYVRRRTWRERLFGRPWRPLVSGERVVPQVPYAGAIMLNTTTLVMHPAALRRMRDALAAGADFVFETSVQREHSGAL